MAYLKSACLLLVFYCACATTLADFKPTLFHSSRPSGFYQINTGSDNTGMILAFDDLNGDQYTDYIATDNLADPVLTAFLWDDANSVFRGFSLQLNHSGSAQVAEALICDLDSDELPEILVTFVENKQYSSQIYDVKCSFGGCTISLQQLDYSFLSNMAAVPFLMDPDGSGHIAILTFTSAGRVVLQYDLTAASPKLKSSSFASFVINPSQSYNAVSMHFAANLDFNSDCNSDLLLLSMSSDSNSVLECFQKANGNSYQQMPSITLPKNVAWLTFADLDSNGAVDLFLVAAEGSSFLPYVIPNPYVPTEICSTQSSFPFSADKLQAVSLPKGYTIASNSNIKFADINLDGLPDILGLFTVGKFKRATVLFNEGGKSFTEVTGLNIEEVATIDNPVQVCAFDLGQNGKMDVLIVNQVAIEGGGSAYLRTSVVNNIIDDSLFIKILPLLATSADFDTGRTSSATGVTVQWRITNIDGDKTIDTLNQKPQWNFGTLQLPFVTGGLGRTNNYIEDLAVGYPGRGQVEVWTPVIPNSQLMVRRETEGDWALETLLKDNSRVYDVIYISIICLLLLGLVVFYLNWRENQQDKRDHYNFIQMIR